MTKTGVDEINGLLPEEMLRLIFSFLPPKDLKTAVLVCKLWFGIGQASGLWSWVTFHASNNESMSEKMRMPRLQNVNRLKITDQNICEDLLEEVARHPGLKVIDTESRWRNLSSVRPELVAQCAVSQYLVKLGPW